jgi:hypothetical protein
MPFKWLVPALLDSHPGLLFLIAAHGHGGLSFPASLHPAFARLTKLSFGACVASLPAMELHGVSILPAALSLVRCKEKF